MAISIEPLDCGTLTAGRSMFERGAGAEPAELPVPAWLIRHPEGNVLFDTGMHPDLTGPSEFSEAVALFFDVGLTESQLIAARLQAVDADPVDIDVVVLSHLHFDHTGGLGMVPDAKVVVQRDEWDAGADPEVAAASFFRAEEYQLGHEVLVIDGEHDIFGDGRITCIPTPGHTPGHQSLRVRLAEREIVLAADCAYFTRTLEGGPLPPVSHDPEQQARSIARLRTMADRGATVLPGHDAGIMAALPERLV